MEDAHRVIIVISEYKRNPYEVWLLAALFLSSILFLTGVTPAPQSVQAALPESSRVLWNIQLLTGSLVALIGMFWKQPTTARTIQIAGHLWVGSGALIYTSVLFYYAGMNAVTVGLIIGSITVAAVTKSLQLRRQIRYIIRKVEGQYGASNLDVSSGGDSHS